MPPAPPAPLPGSRAVTLHRQQRHPPPRGLCHDAQRHIRRRRCCHVRRGSASARWQDKRRWLAGTPPRPRCMSSNSVSPRLSAASRSAGRSASAGQMLYGILSGVFVIVWSIMSQPLDLVQLAQQIKQWGTELGFQQVGIARYRPQRQ